MKLLRSCPSFLLVGALASVAGMATPAESDEIGQVVRVASRCDVYGPGFVDLGNGACGLVMSEQATAPRNSIDSGAPAGAWTVNGTSNAALRSDGNGMLPGISDARHLRIQGNAAAYAR